MSKTESMVNGKAEPDRADATTERADAPVINIRGAKVALGPASRAVVPLVSRWENDFAVTVWAGDDLVPRTREQAEADYDRYAKGEWRNAFPFVIYELASMRPIGICDIRHINHAYGTAELGIMIGEPEYWGKGYGTETVTLLLDYAFTALGLHNVMLDTSSYNERAIRAYRRAGFREIGRRREAKRIAGKVYDVVFMDCLATEFTSPFPPVIHIP